MRLGVDSALVDGQRVAGDVEIDGDRVVRVGCEPAGHGVAVPGLVDLQVNGFGGVDFLAADEAGYRQAGVALAACGVTGYLPTFISSPPEVIDAALDVAATAAKAHEGPRILGVHLEGPFLAPRFAGAHDPAHVRPPDTALADRWCERGPVRLMTVAPEQPGGLELVAHLVGRGVVVSLGHTEADAAVAHAAFDTGAAAVTHLHNAMRRWKARDPGVAGAALARRDVVVQAIVDRVHLADETVQATWQAARGRFAVVTDAIAAAGLGDGRYPLGDRTVRVTGPRAELADGTLAGSVLTLDEALRHLADLGVPLSEAVAATSQVPGRLIGHDATLRPGSRADVAVLDDDLRVVRTLVGGHEAHAQ